MGRGKGEETQSNIKREREVADEWQRGKARERKTEKAKERERKSRRRGEKHQEGCYAQVGSCGLHRRARQSKREKVSGKTCTEKPDTAAPAHAGAVCTSAQWSSTPVANQLALEDVAVLVQHPRHLSLK